MHSHVTLGYLGYGSNVKSRAILTYEKTKTT